MNQQTTLFSNEKLMAMIIPLFLEQLLIMLVGMADTLVVSYAGEAAVSGVSLVNQFNTITNEVSAVISRVKRRRSAVSMAVPPPYSRYRARW